MKIIVKEPSKAIEVREVDDLSLELMQEIVGGYIEVVGLGGGVLLVVNEEGIREQLRPNFRIGKGNIFFGTVFFCQMDGEEMVGLTDEQITDIQSLFPKAKGVY